MGYTSDGLQSLNYEVNGRQQTDPINWHSLVGKKHSHKYEFLLIKHRLALCFRIGALYRKKVVINNKKTYK